MKRRPFCVFLVSAPLFGCQNQSAAGTPKYSRDTDLSNIVSNEDEIGEYELISEDDAGIPDQIKFLRREYELINDSEELPRSIVSTAAVHETVESARARRNSYKNHDWGETRDVQVSGVETVRWEGGNQINLSTNISNLYLSTYTFWKSRSNKGSSSQYHSEMIDNASDHSRKGSAPAT